MPVHFKHFRCNDNAASLTLENVFQHFGSWSGIHQYQFEDGYVDDSQVVTNGGSGWASTLFDFGILPNFSVKFHKDTTSFAVRINASDLDWHVGCDTSGYPFVLTNGQTVTAMKVPRAYPASADVEVVFRQVRVNDREDEVWYLVTLYINGAVALAYSHVATTTMSSVNVGVCAYAGVTTTYTDIRIPELAETAEFGTLDPGEFPMGGLQRTIEGRYLKFFMRFDGSLRAWKKKARDSVLEIDEAFSLQRTYDMAQLITHARMMGAWVWAEAVDESLMSRYGHRFNETNNSMLLTEEECVVESENTLKRSQEATFGLSVQTPFPLILEPEDRITADGESWVVDGYTLSIGAGRVTAVLNCRIYVWEA